MTQVTERVANWLDEQSGFKDAVGSLRSRGFPSGRSGLPWLIAVASFTVCSLTGVFLLFFYSPSTATVVYSGSYAPLRGIELSEALQSTLAITYDLPGGLLVRQLHNWSSSLMIAALAVHILLVFFTGAFRKPRELQWLLLFGVLFASMAAGLTGSVLPDDLLSSNSLAVLDGVLKAIPVVGTWASFLVFQGSFPSGAIATFYPLHVAVLPLAIMGLVALVAVLALRNGPTRWAAQASDESAATPRTGPIRTEATIDGRPVVGRPLRTAAIRAAGVFLVVAGVLVAISATISVNPVGTYGPADPGNASSGAGAVWHLAFLDGAQRLTPSGWEFVWMDRTWTLAILVPVAVSTAFLAVAVLWPFVERFISGSSDGPRS